MAIWQFNLDFYSTNDILKELGKIPVRLPREFRVLQTNWEDKNPRTKFWVNYDRNTLDKLIIYLTNQLPEIEWLKDSSDVFSWGNEKTNDITLSFSVQSDVSI